MADQHLIMAPHTTEHWPPELFLPSTLIDRDNREAWTRAGAKEIDERATDEVNRRLGAYRQLETDPAIDAELQRIIRSGLVDRDAPCRSCRRRRSPSDGRRGRRPATRKSAARAGLARRRGRWASSTVACASPTSLASSTQSTATSR